MTEGKIANTRGAGDRGEEASVVEGMPTGKAERGIEVSPTA